MKHKHNSVELHCEVCHTCFDPHQAPHDWLYNRLLSVFLVCGDCLSAYSEDELLEMLDGEVN